MSNPAYLFLWAAPRCVSTAFARSIYEFDDCKVFHEPYGEAYYFGPEKQHFRYKDRPVDQKATYDAITQEIHEATTKNAMVFSKDMARSMKNQFNVLQDERLSDFKHTFLIRNPKKTITSLYRASIDVDLTGWQSFDPSESGFKELFELYMFVKSELNKTTVIIDADDLLLNPGATMKAYCEANNVTFNEKILSWESGHLDIWNKWQGWQDVVSKSTGFKQASKEKLEAEIDLTLYPEEVCKSIEENMYFYDLMQKEKLVIV